MEKVNKYCFIFIILVLVFYIGYQYGVNSYKQLDVDNIIKQDTTYNHIILDSIQYNM